MLQDYIYRNRDKMNLLTMDKLMGSTCVRECVCKFIMLMSQQNL